MSARRIAALALAGALLAGGTGAAIAAVTKDDGKQAEDNILGDAAKRLNVAPGALHDALAAAEDAQLDQAVKDGTLTQKQADAIKARRQQSGRVLGVGPRGPGFRGPGFRGPGFRGPGFRGPGFRGPGFRGPGFGHHEGPGGAIFPDLAKALGITRAQLRDQLRAGKSIADVAKAQGKTLDDVRTALKADAKARAGKAVKDGDITQAQADEMVSHLDEMLAHLGDARPMFGRRGHRGGHGDGPPRLRPGAFTPGSQAPAELDPAGGSPS